MRTLLAFVTGALPSLVSCHASDEPRVSPEANAGSSGWRDATDAGSRRRPDAASRDAGGDTPGDRECAGSSIEIHQLAGGNVSPGTDVELEGVIATSQKFLVTRSASGSCLWGVFVSADVAAAAEHTGLMIVGYGAPSQAGNGGEVEPCRPGTDAIPDDVAIGDLLSIRGKTEVYQPSWCANARLAGQARVRVSRDCPLSKLGSAEPPQPLAIQLPAATELSRGGGALPQALAGVLVRLSGVSGRQDGTRPDIVGAYGTIRLNETELQVRDKISFAGIGDGLRGLGKNLDFGYPTSFSRIDGVVFLDYCDWVLAPRDKCIDFDPPSADCR